MAFKRPRSPNSSPEKSADKSAKVDECLCVRCNKSVVNDCISCDWCNKWEHRQCASIDEKDFDSFKYENVAFFCGQCLPDVPKALALYNTYSKLDIEFEKKFCAMESELQKGIGYHLVKCFEAANLVALEKSCKKLQTSVEDLSVKITTLSSSNKTLQMEIESTSETLNTTQTTSAPMSPVNPAMRIVDELADRDKRKKNVIVYNLPESAQNSKSDSDTFSALCSSVYNCSFTITKLLRLGKKQSNKIRPLLLCFEHEEDKVTVLSRSHQLRNKEAYKNVFIAPDRTKFQREKHKSLVSELKNRRSKGEKDLVIRNGAIITKPVTTNNNLAHNTTGPTASSQHS